MANANDVLIMIAYLSGIVAETDAGEFIKEEDKRKSENFDPNPAQSGLLASYPRELSLSDQSATRMSDSTGKTADDPALHPPRNCRDLGRADALPHLVRDRGACGRCHGQTRHHPEIGGEENSRQGAKRRL